MRTTRTTLAALAAALMIGLTSCLPDGITTSHPTTPINPTTITTAASGTLVVYFLDVGQGDSEVVTVDGKAMLIDAGTNASTTTLINDIKSIGISLCNGSEKVIWHCWRLMLLWLAVRFRGSLLGT